MIVEVFLIVLIAVGSTISQQMMCTYITSTDNFSTNKYQCDLFVYNPDGLNNSVSIRGNHFTGFSDPSILSVKGTAGTTRNVPLSILQSISQCANNIFFSNECGNLVIK